MSNFQGMHTPPSPEEMLAAKEYFATIVQGYLVGDIESVMSQSKAGPILVVTVTVIDLLGGMLYGFRDEKKYKAKNLGLNSGWRFKEFAKRQLGATDAEVNFLYNVVRNGMVHGGAVEGYVSYDSDVNQVKEQEYVVVRTEQPPLLHLYAGGLALKVLNAISDLSSNQNLIKYRPGFGVDYKKQAKDAVFDLHNELSSRTQK